MRKLRSRMVVLALLATVASGTSLSSQTSKPNERVACELLALERSALDRWIRLDPDGYLGLFADDITYFDPYTSARINGLAAMQGRFAPIRNGQPPAADIRYEIFDPLVVHQGDLAVLTFNLVNYGRINGAEKEAVLTKWNSTEVYRQMNGRWRIVHSHWSHTMPAVTQRGI